MKLKFLESISSGTLKEFFWKQSHILVTDEQCDAEAQRVYTALSFISENADHYTKMSKEWNDEDAH